MRIIQVVNVRWFNATAWYALFLSRLLRDAGHEVIVLTLEGTETHEKALAWGLDARALPLNTVNPIKLVSLLFSLRKLVKTFQPDVVNCHRGESFILWGLLKKCGKGFKLFRTRGDQRLPRNNFPNRWLHSSCADGVISTNSVMHRHFLSNFGIPNPQLHLIPGGVDRDKFQFSPAGRAELREQYGYADSDFIVGLLGRFDEVKGQKELIEAIAALRAQGLTQIKLLLLGFETATSEQSVRTWIAENDMQDATTITGFCPDIAAAISCCDLGVIASKWSETIARAALEFMSCHVPIVSSAVGVMPDLLPADALFAPGDVQDMGAHIKRAYTDGAYYARLGHIQGERIDHLTGADFLQQTLNVYRGLV